MMEKIRKQRIVRKSKKKSVMFSCKKVLYNLQDSYLHLFLIIMFTFILYTPVSSDMSETCIY